MMVDGMDKAEIRSLIRSGKIKMAGYRKKKIYGSLHCRPGKRMRAENRVFFKSEEEAISMGYRPCGHCMREKYILWKLENNLQKQRERDIRHGWMK
jgi:methylphosphotriester-DNA--protein-cysteine methyltransferase